MEKITPKPRPVVAYMQTIGLEHPMLRGLKHGHEIQFPYVRITLPDKFFTVSVQ